MKLSNKLQNSNHNLKSNKGKPESYDVFGKELVGVQQLPELVYMLGYIIKNYGILTQGLFRVSGNKTRMDELRVIYNQSKQLEVGIDDIHNVTGLFKSFLREVPGGVIPCPQSLDLIKATRMYKRSEDLDLLTNELLKLPVPNYNLLKFSCALLNQVSKYSSSNLMTSENLGTVFGPTFFSSVEDLSLLPLANSASAILIHNYNDLFKVSAPVHTNLNQNTENRQRFDETNADSLHYNVTKIFADHGTTIKFGESSLFFYSNGETDNSQCSCSMHDEEPLPFQEFRESFNHSSSFPSQSPFSNSVDNALRLCITNHLFSHFQEDDLANDEHIFTPRLISDTMLNPPISQNPDSYSSVKPSTLKVIGKKKTFEDASASSLPRREISSNILQTYLTNYNVDQKGTEIAKSDSSQTNSDIIMNNDLNYEKQSHPVPQLDLSNLCDTSGSEKLRSPQESKDRDVKKVKTKNENQDFSFDSKTSEVDSPLNKVKRNITNLKRQLRQFEDEYYSTNGVRPDKFVRANNEWYSNSITQLKLLRQEKEQFINGKDKTDYFESESGKNAKSKIMGAFGDATDHRSTSAMGSDNRTALSRPVSALSEVPIRGTPSNESGRSNTLNSMGTIVNSPPDLSQIELDNLKSALEKISNHLLSERIKDNRPTDLNSMTQQQIETEKVSMQKALLNFESTYGRRKSPEAVSLMRPLYDRYRQVKKRLFQMNENQDVDWKIATRTLDIHSKADFCQSAWTSERPLSLNRGSIPSVSNKVIYIPTASQFDIEEECLSPEQRNPKTGNDRKSLGSDQNQRKNVRTIQYRKTTDEPFNDSNNNRRQGSQRDEWRLELQQIQTEKKDLQRILKDFENNFEKDTKRKLEKMDRLPMEREYSRYKTIKNRIKELEDLVERGL